MPPLAVIALFDVGKTNKKLFLINEQYRFVFHRSVSFSETVDEDGDVCEDLENIRSAVVSLLQEVHRISDFDIKAINFAAYGASFAYLDAGGDPIAPLYNYLKPYPDSLLSQFYDQYGGKQLICQQTASPALGSLNSGLQLYRFRHEKPELFRKMWYAMHLPQYLSYLVTGKPYSDITSIGCHTMLWNFEMNRYHQWVVREGIAGKLPPLVPSNYVSASKIGGIGAKTGTGLHDSSAALIPYLMTFPDSFVLISTGTWCISMNPFNTQPLTAEELEQDCLCYLQYQGTPVKASRLFAGDEHEREVRRIAFHFHKDPDYYGTLQYDAAIVSMLLGSHQQGGGYSNAMALQRSRFCSRDLSSFSSGEAAYHQLMMDIMEQQKASTRLVYIEGGTKRIFVDGGFGKNSIYMNLLAAAFPHTEVYAASVPQATALGAALAIHESWNNHPLPNDLIQLNRYANTPNKIL